MIHDSCRICILFNVSNNLDGMVILILGLRICDFVFVKKILAPVLSVPNHEIRISIAFIIMRWALGTRMRYTT